MRIGRSSSDFILASGSLKELAQEYGISYPTVRLRLDRLIDRIKIFESERITSDFEKVLRAQYADGRSTWRRSRSCWGTQTRTGGSI
jgi:hypothetical protein